MQNYWVTKSKTFSNEKLFFFQCFVGKLKIRIRLHTRTCGGERLSVIRTARWRKDSLILFFILKCVVKVFGDMLVEMKRKTIKTIKMFVGFFFMLFFKFLEMETFICIFLCPYIYLILFWDVVILLVLANWDVLTCGNPDCYTNADY